MICHTFASMGAGASLGLPIIGKLLGHSQPTTTARYSHLDADPMRRAADIISGQERGGRSARHWTTEELSAIALSARFRYSRVVCTSPTKTHPRGTHAPYRSDHSAAGRAALRHPDFDYAATPKLPNRNLSDSDRRYRAVAPTLHACPFHLTRPAIDGSWAPAPSDGLRSSSVPRRFVSVSASRRVHFRRAPGCNSGWNPNIRPARFLLCWGLVRS